MKSLPRKRTGNDGKVILFLAFLMFGGALFMIGKTWYTHSKRVTQGTQSESNLGDFRLISPENIQERMVRNEVIRFIDIRPRTSYEENHLIDSVWLGLAEIAYYAAPTTELIVIVHGKENTNEQLKEINALYRGKKLQFAFLDGGINNWITKGGAVITTGNPDSYLDQTKVTPILPEKVDELRATLVRSIMLDVRTESEFSAGHVPDAINLPFAQLEKERSQIPGLGSLIVYGSSELDTFRAGTQLFDMGYFGVRIISGGFEAWKTKGLPIEKKQ